MRNGCAAAGLAMSLVLASGSAGAADFGIGVSARSDDGYLYAPIDVSKSFRLEPSVRYGSSELTFSDDSDASGSQDTQTWELGIGVFGMKQIAEAAHIYFGARLAYVDTESTGTQTTTFGRIIRSESTQDGYRIGPTLGFEYLFGGHFSIGGEASYTFVDLDGESESRVGNFSSSVTQIEQSTQSTQTRLIVRYMF
jgi:hypothetical protein